VGSGTGLCLGVKGVLAIISYHTSVFSLEWRGWRVWVVFKICLRASGMGAVGSTVGMMFVKPCPWWEPITVIPLLTSKFYDFSRAVRNMIRELYVFLLIYIKISLPCIFEIGRETEGRELKKKSIFKKGMHPGKKKHEKKANLMELLSRICLS